MGWVQCVTPNTNDKTLVVYDASGKPMKDWCGWCLAVTQQSFGIKLRKYASAKDCWNASRSKYDTTELDKIPIGVYIPIFWMDNKYGHVAVALRDSYSHIKIWSSPYTHKPYFDYFEGDVMATINLVGKKYGCTYCGWMPILTETKVVDYIYDAVEKDGKKEPEYEETPVEEPVEKPVENPEPTGKEPVENSDEESNNLLVKLINRLINWLRSLIS